MIGLDTNVLVRYIVRDDAAQAALADKVLATLSTREPALVTHVVLCELWWVLGTAYGSPADERVALLENLLDSQGLVIEDSDTVRAALAHAATGADFADALIAQTGARSGCTATLTFDRRAARDAGMTLLEAS